jgi:hypothetical protein
MSTQVICPVCSCSQREAINASIAAVALQEEEARAAEATRVRAAEATRIASLDAALAAEYDGAAVALDGGPTSLSAQEWIARLEERKWQ